MNCLPCFNKDEDDEGVDHLEPSKSGTTPQASASTPPPDASASSKAQAFTFRELAMATKNFRQECLLGEGGFGRVFKGKLQSSGQVVAVKQLDRNGMQANKEFLVEVLMLSLLEHPNLVTLIGYCADGDQRLLVYEFLPVGSLENHLFGDDPNKKNMDWYTRMKIASGAAKGLEYLHDKANPAIIYRDLKPSNILLDESLEPKLSDYGLAKLGAGGGKMHPTSRVMGTYGYSAPEYSSSGELTLKSDIYSFGVVLLELITGRRVIDTNRPNDEQNLVTWAQPIFREPKRFPELADPRLNKEFPVTGLNQAVGICAMCLQEESSVRPLIADVVAALSFLSIPQPHTVPASVPAAEKDGAANAFTPPPEQKMKYENGVSQNQAAEGDKDGSSDDDDDDDDGSSDDSEDEESVRESASENPNEGSSQNSISGSYNTAEGGNNSGRESAHCSERRSVDHSEDESNYSDSDDDDAYETDDQNDDSDHSEYKDPGEASAKNLDSRHSNSKKVDVGRLSSKHGSGKRSSSTKKSGSRRRKMVVTFKEPNLSSKRNDSNKFEEEKVAENRRQSSSSSSESSSESDDEEAGTKAREDRPKASKKTEKHRGDSIDLAEGHQVSDGGQGPKLRHLKTR